MDYENLRRSAEKKMASMYRRRQEYEADWKRYRKAFAPHRGRFSTTEKPRKNRFRKNSRPLMVAGEFSAGMKGGLTSPTLPWFNLAVYDNRVMTQESVKVHLSESRDIMLGTMIRTNMYDQLTDKFEELSPIGTSAMFVEEDETDIFRCDTLTIGEYAIDQDDRQRVDSIGIKRRYTISQLADKFGEEALPPTLRTKLKNDEGDSEYDVCHLVWPNAEYVPDRPGTRWMKFQSLWWLDGNKEGKGEKLFLKIGGYHEFPCIVSRWKVIGDDLYGRGHPGEIGIDDAETIQILETTARSALQRMADPPMLAPESLLENASLNRKPGGTTPYNDKLPGQQPPAVTALFQLNFDFASCEQKIFNLTEALNKAFFVDLFRMWSTDMRQGRTATEIQAREQEKMYVMGPVIERQMKEVLDPLITRIWGIMNRRGMFPPAPEELAGRNLKIEYSSILANIQKQAAQAGIETVVASIGNLAQLQAAAGERPEVIDALDCDETAQQISDMYAIPAGIIRGDDAVAEIRAQKQQAAEQQQQMQQAMQMAQAAPDVTGAMQDMAETPMQGGGNALEAAMAAIGGAQAAA